MNSKPTSSLMPALYSHRIHDIQIIGRASGYALAIHGSMKRDLDVIAVPWTQKAVKAETLVTRLCEALDLGFSADNNPTQKPHGRRCWTLVTLNSSTGYMDLSVMPRTNE
ncbi:MAG TPA: hypothetical protein PKH39_18565 [Woeseiaceae bacterium]|nr:hypothetical protein [Woeseiaceae bacterium]